MGTLCGPYYVAGMKDTKRKKQELRLYRLLALNRLQKVIKYFKKLNIRYNGKKYKIEFNHRKKTI